MAKIRFNQARPDERPAVMLLSSVLQAHGHSCDAIVAATPDQSLVRSVPKRLYGGMKRRALQQVRAHL